MVSSGFVNTNSLLTDIQVSSIVQSLPNKSQSNPLLSYEYSLMMRNRRVKQGLASERYPTLTPALRSWSYASGPSLLFVPASTSMRKQLRDLAVSLVHLIRQTGVTILWALDSYAGGTVNSTLDSTITVLRCLVEQAITLSLAQRTEADASRLHALFSRANNADDLIKLLANLMRDMPVVYIVIDINPEAMDAAERGLNLLSSAIFKTLDLSDRSASQPMIRVFMTLHEGTSEPLQYRGGTAHV